MTKNILTYAVLALFTLGLNACLQEDEPQKSPQNEVQVVRMITRSGDAEPFTKQFTLELQNINDTNLKEIQTVTYGEYGYGTIKSNVLPAKARAWTGNGNATTVATDQSTAELLADADVMTASDDYVSYGESEQYPLDLHFTHAFSWITFHVTYTGFISRPTLTDIKVAGASCFIDTDNNVIEAIVQPDTYTEGYAIITLKANDIEKKATLKIVTDFTAGYHYSYNLNVNTGKDITISPATDFGLEWDEDIEIK